MMSTSPDESENASDAQIELLMDEGIRTECRNRLTGKTVVR
jgi:hypothetical protein